MRVFIYVLIILSSCLLCSCSTTYQTTTYNEPPKGADSLEIHEGILSQTAQRIKYKKDGKTIATIELSEPVMVAMAEQEEPWGYFQFPSVGKTNDGTVRVSWQMAADSHTAYGKRSDRKSKPMMTNNGGRTWKPFDNTKAFKTKGYNVYLRDGSSLHVSTQATKNVKTFQNPPKVIAKDKTYTYYLEKDLPDEVRGFYLNKIDKDGRSTMVHAKLNDPGLLRYAINDELPIIWWGDIKELADGFLVAGVYPTNYLDESGNITRGGVSFYQSKDKGQTWEVISRIPFRYDGIAEIRGNKSYDEPAFEVLTDSTFICVMRTGATSPLYRMFSKDMGRTWTTPEPFTPNGVKPCLMQLQNGALVLASGRPGVQIRVSFDGGYQWTEAIDMVPFMKEDGSFKWDVSCGYASIIDAGNNSFYLAYSDFTTKDKEGNTRKSIWFRKVTIKK